MSIHNRPQPITFREVVSSAKKSYWLIRFSAGDVAGFQFCWHDATTAGSISVYSSFRPDAKDNLPAQNDTETPDLEYWAAETVTVTDPAGTAAGSTTVHLGVLASPWVLVGFDASAASLVSVFAHSKD